MYVSVVRLGCGILNILQTMTQQRIVVPLGFHVSFFFERVSNQLNQIFYCCCHITFNLISADPELRNFFAGSKDGHIRMIKVSIANGKHLHNLNDSNLL